MPETSCKYYKRLIFMWLLLPFFTILTLPSNLVLTRSSWTHSRVDIVGINIMIYCGIFILALLLTPLSLFWYNYSELVVLKSFVTTSLFLWSIIISSVIFYGTIKLFGYTYRKIKYRKKKNVEAKPSWLKERWDELRGKYCKPLNWIKDE